MKRPMMKWTLRILAGLAIVYVSFFAAVLWAMRQPPMRFGAFMRHMPQPVVWMALPAERMWLWARKGTLETGDAAPDFTLARHDGSGRVTLSALRGKPVVLVFGSYT